MVFASTVIGRITSENNLNPKIIKIDHEGAEFNVIKGALNFISSNSPFVVMEYLEPERKNEEHKKALLLLLENDYKSYVLLPNGKLEAVFDIDNYWILNKLESDNIVFLKN